MMPVFSRRLFLSMSAAVGAAGATPALAAAGLDLSRPEDYLNAVVRMDSSTDGRDTPHWYFGSIYAVFPDRAPLHLVDFEGLETSRFENRGENVWRFHGSAVTYFKDKTSGAWLEDFTNPLTGATNAVKANHLGGAAYDYSLEGIRPLFGKIEGELPPVVQQIVTNGEDVWFKDDRVYPDGWRQPSQEASFKSAKLKQVMDQSVASIDTMFASTTIAPYMPWLGMEGQPGFTMWHAHGRKLLSLDEVPSPMRVRVEQLHPQALHAPRV